MRRRYMLMLCAFLLLTLLAPFQVTAAESGSTAGSDRSMVAGGASHTLAIKQEGTVWAWGDNESGQLGDGTTIDRYTPVQVQGLDSVIAVSAGIAHSLALKGDGTVWAWGDNNMGELGDGSTTNRHTPVQVTNLSSVVAIASGNYHNLAVTSDGTVWAWGANFNGQLGDGSLTERYAPVQVKGLNSVINVAAGLRHSLALKSDGTVWAWGSNELGQNGVPGGLSFGDGTGATYRHTPVHVESLGSVTDIAAGAEHSLALNSDGTVWAWGWNGSGQLGDGTTTDRHTPVQVQGLDSVIVLAKGGVGTHTIAIKSDGTAWAWGRNSSGQLGDGSTTNRSLPVQVTGLDSVVAIAVGGAHNLAVKSDGTVWAWGDNSAGQLGDGTREDRHTPVQTISSEAPQWPEGDVLTVADVTYNSAELNWKAATDETGVDKYLVYQDETLLATLNGDENSYEVKGLSPASSYLFSLIAVDADDNQSEKKEELVTTPAYNPVPKAEMLLYRFNGTILDFDQSRILWKQTGDKVLWLYDRTDGSQVKVHDVTGSNDTIGWPQGLDGTTYGYPDAWKLAPAKLSSEGVVYTLWNSSVPSTYHWKDGMVQEVYGGRSPNFMNEVKGDFAVLIDSVVNVKTGEYHKLPNAFFHNRNSFDLSADGTVVYEYLNGYARQLPDGSLTEYSPPSNEKQYDGPLTDGKNILYSALIEDKAGHLKWSLRVRSDDGQIATIAMNPFQGTNDYNDDSRKSYQINNGWIAYKEYNQKTGRWNVAVRSPEGVTKQVYTAPRMTSWTNVPLSIKQLAPDGTVAFTFKDTTYLYSAEESRILFTFTGTGEPHYRDGEWYRIDGGSLFQIHPDQLQLSDSKTYQEGGSNYEYALYYGYISSPGQELSGSWTPPEGFHGVVKVSMISPEGEDYDLSLETVGEGNRLPEETTKSSNGAENSAAEVPEGYTAVWRIKGHTDDDYSPDKKVLVYVNIQYDNR